MHYHAEVFIPPELLPPAPNVADEVEKAVDDAMEGRWVESSGSGSIGDYEEEFGEDKFWDWYQIGGRWKGVHVPEYDADKDPEHIETCWLCEGTGKRKDGLSPMEPPVNGCNGCLGTGKHQKWPTQWEMHAQDIIEVDKAPKGLQCHTLVTPKGTFHIEEWNGADFVKNEAFDGNIMAKLKELGYTKGLLVTVDYHN